MKYTPIPTEQVTPYEADRANGIVGMMDCGGSNLVKIREQLGDDLVKVIATSRAIDHPDSGVAARKEEFGVPVALVDIEGYESRRGIVKGDYRKSLDPGKHGLIKGDRSASEVYGARAEICRQLSDKIKAKLTRLGLPENIPHFGAGFMGLLSPEFVGERYILNIHPADLRVRDDQGVPYLSGNGSTPSRNALKMGYRALFSTMHRMESKMDQGAVHMVGYHLRISDEVAGLVQQSGDAGKVARRLTAKAAQEALKHLGDHVAAGATFMDLFEGNWGQDTEGTLCYRMGDEWYRVPLGITIKDHVRNNPGTPFKRERDFIDDVVNEFEKTIRGELR